MTRPRIVIIGAGFGGLAAARALARAEADILLIDRTNYHLFQPLLYQVATAALSPADIATATRVLLRGQTNAAVIMGEVVGVDAASRRVKIDRAPDEPYDYLVVAAGAAYSFFGHDEWSHQCLVLKTLDDAIAIRGRLLASFERAERRADPEEVRRLLTFVIVGGGPTGVELAGNIAELARSALAGDFRHIDPAASRVLLCESGPRVLSEFPLRLSHYADAALRSLGVEVRTGTEVTGIDGAGLMAGTERIDTVNIFWAAGTAARPAAAWLGVKPAHHGAINVGADCAVEGLENVFVIGDAASQSGKDGHPLPGLGAVAKQQGAYVGRLLAARISGRPAPGPFRYRDLGTLAIIGRSRAVAKLPGLALTGWIAWLLWCLVHLMLLVDVRSKFAVYLNWSWTWLTNGRAARLVIGAPEEPEDSAGRHEEAA